MKNAFLIAVAALCATAVYAADDDIMAAYYGNTFYVTDSSGTKRVHYNPDHTFTEVDQQNHSLTGIWAIKDGKMCETPDGAPEDCNPIRAGHKAGDAWTGGGGKSLKIKLGPE